MMPRAKKSYGQNFLVDKSVVKKIIAAAEIVSGENVLEIGPGTGVLTEALVAAGAKVTAVEADHDLIAPLREKFGDTIELIEGDIFEVVGGLTIGRGRGQVTPPITSYKLIANIPYNITSKILEHFLTTPSRPSRMVLMVQREVADRILAKSPDMSLLSVVCQLYADVKRVTNVSRGSFRPIPKVDSAIIILDTKYQILDTESIIHLAKTGFSSPRKQLHRNLASAGRAPSDQTKRLLVSLGLPETVRAENLSVHNWIQLHALL